MTATAKDITVDFGGTKKDLSPITFDTDNKWKIAAGDVDPIYGDATGLAEVPSGDLASTGSYFSEYVVYLATAGDSFTGTLQFDFNGIANLAAEIAPAYTLALYIADTAEEIAGTIDWTKPDADYSVEDANNKVNEVGSTGFVDTGKSVTIPSTYGKTQSNAVGLKVIIRIYVDGALKMDGVKEVVDHVIPVAGVVGAGEDDANTSINETTPIAAITNYDYDTMKDWKFYTDLGGTTPYVFTEANDGIAFSEVGVVAYCTGATNTISHPEATYVNNTTVPSAGTSFSVAFRVEKTVNP